MTCMFNELSVTPVGSREIVCSVLRDLVKSCLVAKRMGFEEIRLHERSVPDLFHIQLHTEYSIANWLVDGRVDEDLRDRFRDIVTSSPLVSANEILELNEFTASEFSKAWNNDIFSVWGLGAAFIFETLAISLRTHEEWHKETVEIRRYFLDDDLKEIIDTVLVKHFSNEETLSKHAAWWDQYRTEKLEKSVELWQKRADFFPNLVLCGEVEGQLEKLGLSKMFLQIVERLKTLNDVAREWKEGAFDYELANKKTNLRISSESQTTINKFGTLRNFSIPGIGKKLFSLHIKTGNLRFHFYPDNSTKTIYVGYVGKHLRTASDK